MTTNRAAALRQDEIVVVKLWEAYLLYHPANLYKTLTDVSLDNGPLDDSTSGRIVFRFSVSEFNASVKPLLYQYKIPVNIQSDAQHLYQRDKAKVSVLR